MCRKIETNCKQSIHRWCPDAVDHGQLEQGYEWELGAGKFAQEQLRMSDELCKLELHVRGYSEGKVNMRVNLQSNREKARGREMGVESLMKSAKSQFHANVCEGLCDRHGSPAGIGALTRTRTRQNPYPYMRVRVRVRVGGATRDPRNPSDATSFLVEGFSLGSIFGVPAAFMSLSGLGEVQYSQTHQFTRVHTGTRGSSENSEADPYPYPERPHGIGVVNINPENCEFKVERDLEIMSGKREKHEDVNMNHQVRKSSMEMGKGPKFDAKA
ncbi:hypothetical protein B0H12DRAFT_1071055 [Mycena haematopus]|nr:hypothetical protein B0H12DRAFT_1071055 [Mycena haematopus]